MIKYLLAIAIFLCSCGKSNGIVEPIEDDVVEQDSISNENPDPTEETEDTTGTTTNIEYYLYIGTYTDGGSKGIYLSNFDADSGIISKPVLAATITNPSFQCITADKSELWTITESGSGQVAGFKINKEDGSLTKFDTKSTKGNGPCYVSYDNISKSVFAANYGSGNTARVAQDGTISSDQHTGKGPNAARQEGPHAHSIKIDLNGKYAYSCDLGTDKVYAYDLTKDGLIRHTEINTAAGAGPRHLDFHPTMKAMSVINELNSTIEVYTPDADGCFTQLLETVATKPDEFTANNQCADIHYSPDGKFLYGSNRGHNSIVVYKVDETTMKLDLIGYMQEAINWPRNFALTPDGAYLVVANQNSNLISVYAIDKSTGLLTYTENKLNLSKPVCLTFMTKE